MTLQNNDLAEDGVNLRSNFFTIKVSLYPVSLCTGANVRSGHHIPHDACIFCPR